MADNIVITQAYFANNKAAIDALNEFFAAAFKVKNFPFLDEESSIDKVLEKIISRLDAVDPTWLEDEGKLNGIIEMINEQTAKIDPVEGIYQSIVDSNNTTLINAVDGYVGFKMLQIIADNFQDFGKLVNGIYTFELFTKPSAYSDVMDIFSRPIEFSEIPDLDIEERIYSDDDYVSGVFSNDGITIPAELTPDTESERLKARQDLVGIEVFVDDAVQEAAEVNYFENTKPAHVKYSEGQKRYIISNEFNRVVDNLISGLRSCDTTDDLVKFFDTFKSHPNVFAEIVCPYILTNVFTNKKKYSRDPGTKILDYSKSYESILSQNKGANRFKSYDLFSTFKTDKEGTIKFLEDFLKLNLVNNKDASIANNTLLNLFNIFDSRIYLDIIYNITPESARNGQNENQFVTGIRGIINKNSRTKTSYNSKDKEAPETDDADAVTEYVSSEFNKFGEMSTTDLLYCEQYGAMVHQEIESIGNKAYNLGISPFLIEEYIGESYYDINSQMDDIFEEASMKTKRDAFQQGVCSLMANMEEIVKLDKEHRWNANTLGSRYKTTTNPVAMFLFPIFSSITASSEEHTNIKQVYHSTRKALKGKRGSFTSEQLQAIQQLNDLTGDLWGTVKMFWTNPRNWFKMLNVMKNDKTQKRTRKMADIARKIVALKPKLDFIINNDDFVNECWYDGSPNYVFQEATTEDNLSRLGSAAGLVIRDMKKIVELNEKGQWNNNACVGFFTKEIIINLKQALKYTSRAHGGSCGKLDESAKSACETLSTKASQILKNLRVIKANPLIGKNIKSAKQTIDIANLAKDIAGMESSFEFVKNGPVKDTGDKTPVPTEEPVKEYAIPDFNEFCIAMEAAPLNDGSIPDYMKNRMKMNDNIGTTITPTGIPNGVPHNPISDLTDSIDTKVDNGGDTLESTLGSGFDESKLDKKDQGKIVYNITNNYTNSFNQNSNNTETNTTTNTTNDSSSGKTTTTTNNVTNTNSHNNSNSGNDNSHHNTTDASANKSNTKNSNTKNVNKQDKSDHSTKTTTSGSNNNNNSNGSVDDSPTTKDGEQKLSSGKTVQEMFMFLESSEPHSLGSNATYPKEDTLTKAMDRDRESLPKQQKAKKGLTKAANTGKAVLKPIDRTKQWLTKTVDSLIKRDEDKVKAELIENTSYRSTVFKASRLALKLGLTGVFWAINPWIAGMYVGVQGLKLADKPRLKKEVMREMEAELQVIDEKIRDLDRLRDDSPETRKQKYEYMRMKKKIEDYLIRSPHATIKSPKDTW